MLMFTSDSLAIDHVPRLYCLVDVCDSNVQVCFYFNFARSLVSGLPKTSSSMGVCSYHCSDTHKFQFIVQYSGIKGREDYRGWPFRVTRATCVVPLVTRTTRRTLHSSPYVYNVLSHHNENLEISKNKL